MDLRNDIKKATSLIFIDDDAKFYRLHGLSQAAKDRKMNERKVRKPRNIHVSTYVNTYLKSNTYSNIVVIFDIYITYIYIYIISVTESDDYTDININNKVKPTFDKYEVSAAVREVSTCNNLIC